jgi:hypothetical protein
MSDTFRECELVSSMNGNFLPDNENNLKLERQMIAQAMGGEI